MKPVQQANNANLTLKLTVAALASAGVLSSASVWAQAAASAAPAVSETNTVVVTGVRRAAQTAQKIKQDSDDIVDSIVADDIGKFPDTNVAQTLARVSGIQVRRDAGEANTVLIRGLPGIATTLNGREVFTTIGRYIQLADIPSTMLQRVDVYKSQSADLLEGGIAGVVDVRTYRPFDFRGQTINAIAGAKNFDKSKKTDPEAAVMYSNRWKTGAGEFGALVGVSYVKSDFWEERSFNTFPIQKDWLLPDLTGPDLVGLQAIYGQRERTATNFAFQYRPNASVELYAEGLATRYKNTNENDFFVGLPWAAPGDTITGTKIPGTNQLDELRSRNTFTVLSTQAFEQENRTGQLALGAKWKVNSGLRATTELARTTSKYTWKNPILDVGIVVPNVFVKTNVNGSAFMEYRGPDTNGMPFLADPNNSNLLGLFDRYGRDSGSSTDWRADAFYTPDGDGIFTEFSAGVRLAKREAESVKSFEGSIGAPGGIKASTIPGLNCTAPELSENYGTQGWYTPCSSYLLNDTGVVRKAVTGTSDARAIDPGSYFQNTEKNASLYVKSKLAFDIGSIPVDGVIGVRYVKTDSALMGKSAINVEGQPTTYRDTPVDNSGSEVLPSASFKAKLPMDLVARLAYAKTMTRPDFAQLNPGTAYVRPNGNTVQPTAAGGNPALKPFTGQGLDAALEWYFAPTGMVGATVFRHNFDGYIVNQVSGERVDGITFDTTRPINSDKGRLQGIELSYRQFYDSLPGWLSGFGMEANYTYTEGGVTAGSNPVLNGKPFPGLSKNSYNVVALYEKGGVSARLAYNWRSKFVQLYADRAGNAGDMRISPARDLIAADMSTLDGSLSYKLTKNLSVNLTGTNLLNFKYVDYWTDAGTFPRDTRRYDRTVGLSLNWKM